MQNFHLIILLKPYLHGWILILARTLCHEINVPIVHLIMTLREVANRPLRSLIQTSPEALLAVFMIIQYFVVTCVEGEASEPAEISRHGEIYAFDQAVYNLKPYAEMLYLLTKITSSSLSSLIFMLFGCIIRSKLKNKQRLKRCIQ